MLIKNQPNRPPTKPPTIGKFAGKLNPPKPGNGGKSIPGSICQDPQGNASSIFLAVSAMAIVTSGENATVNIVVSAVSIKSVFNLGHSSLRAAVSKWLTLGEIPF